MRINVVIKEQPDLQLLPIVGLSAAEIANLSKESLAVGYRYALKALNPFVILGNEGIYDADNARSSPSVADGSLDLYSGDTGKGSLSEAWITDRSQMLATLIARNVADVEGMVVSPGIGQQIKFSDRVIQADGSRIEFQAIPFTNVPADPEPRQYVFGKDDVDEIIGRGKDDHLYGNGGNDVLEGKGGDDYIEGGRGTDLLIGNEGNDTLYSLDNTPGDRLRGGTGLDTYYVDFGDSVSDTPEAAGAGRIYVGPDQLLLAGGTRNEGENFYKSADGRLVYSTDGIGAIYARQVGRAGQALRIEAPTGPVSGLSDSGNSVTVGRPDLGISLVTLSDGRARPPEVSATPSIAELFKLAGTWKPRKDPLALDLGAPGIHTLDELGEGIVRFDHDGNGSRTGTGWLTGEDAWVVLDRDGDGDITIGAELFGVDTQLPNGTLAHNGYEAIAPLDTNLDRKVDAFDLPLVDWQIKFDVDGNEIIGEDEYRAARFADLQLWRDINRNGYSEPNELEGITSAGIVSISTVMTPSGADLPGGNRLIGTSSYTRSNGTIGLSGALDLARETFYRDFVAPPDYDPSVDALPSAKGSGRVRNLQEAAASSSALRAALLSAASAPTRETQWGTIDEVLRQWADSSVMRGGTETARELADPVLLAYTFEGIPSTSILQTYEAAANGNLVEVSSLPEDWFISRQSQAYRDQVTKIEVLERFIGQHFLDITHAPVGGTVLGFLPASSGSPGRTVSLRTLGKDLLSSPLTYLNESYEILKETVYGPIAAQTRLKPYIDAAVQASESRNFSAVEELLLNTRAANRGEGLADLVELGRYVGVELIERGWIELPKLIESWSRDALADPALADLARSLRIGIRSATTAQGSFYGDILLGSDAGPEEFTRTQTSMFGMAGNDFLMGAGASEVIYGGAGNDIISLGSGGKRVIGGGGRDLYFFGRASGTVFSDTYVWDPVVSDADLDVIQLLAGIRPEDVRVRRETHDNQFEAASLGITIAGSTAHFIDKFFSFGDTTASRTIDALRFADGTTWDLLTLRLKTLEGSSGNDELRGYSDSDDVIEGLAGNDFLRGLQGNDHLIGGEGADALEGGRGVDILDGGPGADRLYGGLGVDIYLLRANGGHDSLHRGNLGLIIEDYNASFTDLDVVRADQGIEPEHLRLLNTSGGLLMALAGGNTSMLDTGNSFNPDYLRDGPGIARIEFASGLFWDAAEIRRRSLLGATQGGETIWGYANSNDMIAGLAGNDSLFGFAGDDTLAGDEGDDRLFGDPGNDVLLGGLGDDTLEAGTGNDTLQGGGGKDQLRGGTGNDIYLFSRGDGQDSLIETAASLDTADVLRFDAGIAPGDVILVRDSNNLYLELHGGGDSLTLSRHDLGLDRVEFADGTIWNQGILTSPSVTWRGTVYADVMQGGDGEDHLQGVAGNDTLSGGRGEDFLEGGAANDWLTGGEGDDRLVGDEGDDRLEGGAGSDLYVFAAGFGRDLLIDTGDSGIDVIRFAQGFDKTNIALTRDVNFIYLEARDSSDVVSFARAALGLERVEFFDSTTWTQEELLAATVPYRSTSGSDVIFGTADADNLSGFAGNDFIDGGEGDDFLDGGAGNDRLIGGDGDDTLFGATGDDVLEGDRGNDTYFIDARGGNDRIVDTDPTDGNFDTLSLGADIPADDLIVAPQGNNLTLSVRTTGQTITLVDWLSSPDARIETVSFDDGSSWDAETLNLLIDEQLNIAGSEGDDTLQGTDAGEVLSGLAGNDWLSAGGGSDILDGGEGDDELEGDEG
ncbi:MAG: calcium-binding protein, partial [Burkholderiales bacterium]